MVTNRTISRVIGIPTSRLYGLERACSDGQWAGFSRDPYQVLIACLPEFADQR